MCICLQRCTEKSGRSHEPLKKKCPSGILTTIVGGGVSEPLHLNSELKSLLGKLWVTL